MSAVGVVGNLSVDVVNGATPRPGGGPFHAARALREVEPRAVVVARCAAGDRRWFANALTRSGIGVRFLEGEPTARFRIDYDGERRTMRLETIPPPCPLGAAVEIADAVRGLRWLHVAPLVRSDFPPETLAFLARGRRISLDGQGLVRPAREGPMVLDGDCDLDALRPVSILKLAEDEALALVGGMRSEQLRSLGVPEVVVTLGSRGSIVFANGLAEHVATRAVRPARDPTGAGDAFAAAYLVGRSRGFTPSAAARWASAVVAAVLSGRAR